MDGPHPSNGDAVKDLYRDLNRKYRLHGPKIEQIWRSLNQAQRTKVMKAGAADGVVLRHPSDTSLGSVYKFIPEWNLRDITAPGSNFLLDLLKHRATAPLTEQYTCGVDGRPGDYEHIENMMNNKGLRHANDFRDCYTFFLDDMYGNSVKLVKEKEDTLDKFMSFIRARVCVPQEVGELILTRQLYLLQTLNIIIEDILDEGSTTRSQNPLPKKSADAATAAMFKLTIRPAPTKLNLPDLHASALEQKAVLSDSLNLLCTEPVVLAHSVNIWFFSRPELVPDEKGRMLPAHTDKYISAAVLEAVHNAVKGTAIWDYMCRLLEELLKDSTDKTRRAVILQEVANICNLEYTRAQSLLKRHVSTGTGFKWFKRISNANDNGNARVSLKGDPEQLLRENAQLHHLLRLCQPETNATKAVDWIKNRAHPLEEENLAQREVDALGDLAVIVNFVQSLSPTISLPSSNRKKGRLFVARSGELEAEMNRLKAEVDLTDFAIPIDNLLEPGKAESALKTLDQFIVEKAGTKLGFLYQDAIDDFIQKLRAQLEVKAKEKAKTEYEYVPLPPETPQTPEVRVQERRKKEKTRPAQSSTYEIDPSKQSSTTEEDTPVQPEEPFKVKPSTAEVFTTLFSRSEARGAVPWARFEAAMGDLGFSVTPRMGSIYTFLPPEDMDVKRPITFHRPHKSNIEGYLLLIYARRLKRVYGWAEQTFKAV